LNRVFDVANIKYDKRPTSAYTHAAKPGIENITKKQDRSQSYQKKIVRRGRLLLLLLARVKVVKMEKILARMLRVRRPLVNKLVMLR
jgi:hypothetical protein